MKFTGKILFNETIQIENVSIPIKKTEIFSKILENDIVEYEINNEENVVVITKIIKRKAIMTLAYIRSFSLDEKKVYFKLPLYNDTFSFFYNHENLKEFSIGSLYIVNVNFLGLDIIEYIGNIKNLLTIKKGIEKILNNTNGYLLNMYKNNLPIQDENIEREYIDLTHLDTFNIDPEGAKDIDDAVSIDVLNNKIYVHIVDIHNQIGIGSSEDLKFLNQSLSLYLADKTYHCINKEISCDLLSLRKDTERKTITFEYTYNPYTLEIVESKIIFAKIINKNSYSYDEYDQKLNDSNNIDPIIIFIRSFTDKWKLRSFSIPIIKFHIDKGYIKSISKTCSNTMSHKFIETLMILSNYTYSNHIKNICDYFPKRNHPKTINTNDMQVQYTGIDDIDNFINIKRYKKLYYSIKDIGHFGIDLEYYAHFTSPIRRYIDLINHRIFNGCVYDKHLLNEILNHVSEQEKMLGRMYDWYFSVILHKYLKISKDKIFIAYVTNINKNGINFLIPDLMFENYIHVSKINKEKKSKWLLVKKDEESYCMSDQYDNKINIGDKISVRIDNITLFQITFSICL